MSEFSKAVLAFEIPELKLFKRGKVREVYDLGERLLLAASDRISAFDCVLPTGIPNKGMVLNQLSAWWFEHTKEIIPNHVISTESEALPDGVAEKHPDLKGRSMLVMKTEALPVECVVRGYLIGSGWTEYQQKGSVCGISLRSGYQMADQLDEPIFTPSSKAESGHDENITFEETVERVGESVAVQLRDASLALYAFAAKHALGKGIIIADTKFEFGLHDGRLTLIDEALTPDSSRFWPKDSYRPGESPFSFDKQYVRDYLLTLDWDKTPPAPPLPQEVIAKTREKYIQAYEWITGEKLRYGPAD
ncbi:MAG: phosphoribosylaminoimidazolesuccinocarboxamide synthase [Kiritimatiellae bacterium]|nr:phosphoribosylaminoimidazolesuccinocarboxamide synthase [Kiritimatiellia bacterium]MDD4735705.1 phosphoribosylaminoimidazolesuccinocarboxamide synthase [Kiritimatiellia bacterium]